MTQTNSELVVYSITREDRAYLAQTLTRMFRNYLDIIAPDEKELLELPFKPKAVLVTQLSRKTAVELFPESKIIEIDRMVSGYNLERIMMLPQKSAALVANLPKSSALETVNNLYSMGIKQIKLVPYWPGSKIETSLYDTVIYTGFKHYAPENMKNYIDIGHRNIATTTIVEIIKTYNLPSECLNKYTENNARQIVNICYQIASAYNEAKNIKEVFEQQCNLSQNASIYIDHEDVISIFNPGAEKVFSVTRSAAIGTDYRKTLSGFGHVVERIAAGKPLNDHFITINEANYLLTLNSIDAESHRRTLVNLTPVETLQRSEAKARKKMHAKGFVPKYSFSDILGSSETTQKVTQRAKHYAESDATVLIIGESGTGKELFAQSIHNASKRRGAAFVGLNFAALPESLAESELFGHEEGAFTGAAKGGRAGLFEVAHNGTIFLDEIGDASLAMQVRLLRVIEEREIMRVGSSRVIPVDIRIICATNRDLSQLVREGKFRQDLYYRICILPLRLPPLRERRKDIPDIMRASKELACLDKKTVDELVASIAGLEYDWPGNIRELKSIMQYISVMYRERTEQPVSARELLNEIHYQFFGCSGISSKKETRQRQREPRPAQPDRQGSETAAILTAIEVLSQSGRPVGRYSLAKTKELRHLNLSETRIKTRLKKLADQGYIVIRKTKQGVILTDKGKETLRRSDTV
ncbi:Sigma-54 interaction domain protein [uncultured delta proteobacterium]|uniref:Sigma-54 interaction domain protein n=1 Tax=uncultured delta proteobacterium TaxID=34034 RepID=A0A212KA54_9DELT|nr:Sigma-54 interaction domain protein [uncultured delta proteobacterium]